MQVPTTVTQNRGEKKTKNCDESLTTRLNAIRNSYRMSDLKS